MELDSAWQLAQAEPIYGPEWPWPERGTTPQIPCLLGYWRNAQFVLDIATGLVWYRVQHDPIWQRYCGVNMWKETAAGVAYIKALKDRQVM